jgi:hypothetical protein
MSSFEIVGTAELRIDGVVVAHGVGAAQRSLGLELAHRVNGHEPDYGDTQGLEAIELRGDTLEVAAGGEGAWVDLVDQAVAQPVRRGTRGEFRQVGVGGAFRVRERRRGQR